MAWLIATCVIFGVVFLTIVTVGTALALSNASDNIEFGIFMIFTVGVAGLAAMLFAWFPASWAQTHYNERTISCHVTGKDRAGKDDGMRIYTSCGVFQNTDSILRGKNTSADVYGRVQVGKTQTFRVVGWRFGLTSDFPNVLEVK
jgi:hypothetical protein